MADKERDTRVKQKGHSFFRVEIPTGYAEQLGDMYVGNKKNNWGPLRERDAEIFKKAIKPLVDDFKIGSLSADRASSGYAHLKPAAKDYANKKKVSYDTAFDKLKELQVNAMNAAIKRASK